MLLKKFKAKEVFGYLDFNIDFNKDITLIHGINGTGKTTVLKLIQAMLTPSFQDFHNIDFKELELSYIESTENKEKTITMKIKKDDENIFFKILVSGKIEYEFEVATIDELELDYILRKDESYFNEFLINNRTEPLIEFIMNINEPLFLGLDRKTEKFDIDTNRNILRRQRHDIRNQSMHRRIRNKLITGSLGISLMQSEFLVQSAYERIIDLENKQRNKLRNELLFTSFDYTDIDDISFNDLKDKDYLSNIIARQSEIENNLLNLGDDSEELINKAKDFFIKLEKLKTKSSDSETEALIDIELITNKVQINRMEKLITTIDSHKSKVDEYFKDIRKFLDTINRFFHTSEKVIEINNVGQIKIKKPNGRYDSIEALSSGERQLIIIFIYLIFEQSDSKIFIIDEPELSLHLQWQDLFTNLILEVSPNTQFILATHSPEIVAGYENKTTTVR